MRKEIIAKADDEIEEFCALIQSGVEAWVKAGKQLSKMVKKDHEVYGRILQKLPFLSREILEMFERIGRRELYPYLAIEGTPGSIRLSTLPYDEQVKLHSSRVAVVVVKKGQTEQSFKRVSELSASEAGRVFQSGRLMTVQEQRTALARRKHKVIATHWRTPEIEMPRPAVATPDGTGKRNPLEDLKRSLESASNSMITAREALALHKRASKADDLISIILGHIGTLRLAVNENDL